MKATFHGYGPVTEIVLAGVRFKAHVTKDVTKEVAEAAARRPYFSIGELVEEVEVPVKRRGRPRKVKNGISSDNQE